MNRGRTGFYFILPWLIGLILFTLFPLLAALYIAFTDWSIIGNPVFIGMQNFFEIFRDSMFYQALWVTVKYAIFAVPLTIATAFAVAVLLNNQIKLVAVFRTIYYMPAIVSGVAVAIVFKWVLDPNYGVINSFLAFFHIKGPNWLYDPDWVLPSYLVMALWGASGGLLTYLVGLKDIPRELYESANIDGANVWHKIRYITIPMITPILFYNLIMGLIAAFRKFTDAYILGGAGNEGTFYMVYLYDQAFSFYQMGYATALAWILFVIILTLSIIINVTRKYWVHT
jgi:multiple sugar transport system permease protein